MGRNALILVVGFAVILGIMRLALHGGEQAMSQVSYDRFEESAARNAAHGGISLAVNQLRQNPDWRTGFTNLVLDSVTVNVDVIDSLSDPSLAENEVRVEAYGALGGDSAEVFATMTVDELPGLGSVFSALTANSNTQTLGTMKVDGRDHAMWDYETVYSGSGTWGIVTSEEIFRGGNSMIGGTTPGGVDYEPARTGWDPVVLENYVWPGGFPQTPEEAIGGTEFGWTPGSLKELAQSGFNGSQYVTDPLDLVYPLQGVTYVEMPTSSGSNTWQPVDLLENGTGLLVVHNDSTNAMMYNINACVFRGMIISDDLMHMHATVVGAVFVLTEEPAYGNCIGNGTGDILYSRESLRAVLGAIGMPVAHLDLYNYWE